MDITSESSMVSSLPADNFIVRKFKIVEGVIQTYDCMLRTETLTLPGRIYFTENYLCFYSKF
jgi:hypothetical protein